MRAATLTLVATLWFSTAIASPRNGETGILIVVKRFETRIDGLNHQTFVICTDQWQEINHALDQGQPTRIFLNNIGYYDVVVNEKGKLTLLPLVESSEIESSHESFSLVPRDCPFALSKSDSDC